MGTLIRTSYGDVRLLAHPMRVLRQRNEGELWVCGWWVVLASIVYASNCLDFVNIRAYRKWSVPNPEDLHQF
ncbi:hypothetical protein [Pasteuria penetrans]|uniref:hypothetical protein n=1 Tax=Pasteuria penetrans TaxID=86005 RepID=UPI001FE5C1BC|nr:hypothetical protein [Pasteuria penetrans]